DVGEGECLEGCLRALHGAGKPVYFVLGNRDFYDRSFGEVREAVLRLERECPGVRWLPGAGVVPLGPSAALVGLDGGAEGRGGGAGSPPGQGPAGGRPRGGGPLPSGCWAPARPRPSGNPSRAPSGPSAGSTWSPTSHRSGPRASTRPGASSTTAGCRSMPA